MKKQIMPPTYFIVLLILSIVLHFTFPIWKIMIIPYTYFGWVLIAFGAVLNIWADQLFKMNKTTVKPGQIPIGLVTTGPFKISRHPMYLGMLAILLGTAIVSGALIAFIFPIVFIVLMEILFMPLEEKNMEKTFGKEYIKYKNKVRRWI